MLLALLLSLSLNLAFVALTLFQHKSLEKKDRKAERERLTHLGVEREFLDRIMHLSGSTWTPPPRETKPNEEAIDEETKLVLEGWVDA